MSIIHAQMHGLIMTNLESLDAKVCRSGRVDERGRQMATTLTLLLCRGPRTAGHCAAIDMIRVPETLRLCSSIFVPTLTRS